MLATLVYGIEKILQNLKFLGRVRVGAMAKDKDEIQKYL